MRKAAKVWTPFSPIAITEQMKKDNPALERCSVMFANSRYQVEAFECSSEIGGIVQLVVRKHLDDGPISWDDLQRVKNDLYGPLVTAVEVYPPQDMEWRIKREVRVLWVLPTDHIPPYGFHIPTAWGRTGSA